MSHKGLVIMKVVHVFLPGLLLMMLVVAPPLLWANQDLGHGLQLAFLGSYHRMVYSEFPGTSDSLSDPDTARQFLIDLPELGRDDYGLAGRIGFKGKEWGLAFQFTQNQMRKLTSQLAMTDTTLTLNLFDLNGKYYVLQVAAVKSYFIFGLGYATLTGSELIQPDNAPLQSGTFTGLGYNLGIGFSLHLNQNVFIFSDYIYRGLSFYRLNHHDLNEVLSHPLHAVYLGIGYTIGFSPTRTN